MEACRNLLDRGDVVLTEPIAGEAVRGLQGELPIGEARAEGWSDPGFEGGLAQVALERVLHLVPQLAAGQHHAYPIPSVPNLRTFCRPVRL